MKKLALLLIITSSVFAKFPHENDAKGANQLKFSSKLNLSDLKQTKNLDGIDYDLTQGKIEAAIYNMKFDKVEELKQSTLELLMRVSTVVKLNMDRSEPIHVDSLISEIKVIENRLERLDIDLISMEGIALIEEEIENKTYDLEELLLDL